MPALSQTDLCPIPDQVPDYLMPAAVKLELSRFKALTNRRFQHPTHANFLIGYSCTPL
jgi:hypothetical protein